MKPSPIYRADFLMGELHPAALQMNWQDFIHFQTDTINNLAKGFDIDSIKVAAAPIGRNKGLGHELSGAVSYGDLGLLENYRDHLDFDDLSPLVIQSPGSALFGEALMSSQDWRNHPLHLSHCLPFGITAGIALGYHFPLFRRSAMIMLYFRHRDPVFPPSLTEEYVEYISFPFYLCWLYKMRSICQDTLKEWLGSCADMSQARFLVLRAMAGQGIAKASDLAEGLGLSVGTIRRHTENAYEALLRQNADWVEVAGNASRVIDITRQYHFFRYGPGNIRRPLPRRMAITA